MNVCFLKILNAEIIKLNMQMLNRYHWKTHKFINESINLDLLYSGSFLFSYFSTVGYHMSAQIIQFITMNMRKNKEKKFILHLYTLNVTHQFWP